MGETGWYFCGRERLLRRVIGWLEGAERGLFAVTGSPGTGKSALLGRIATLSVPALRAVAEEEGALNDTPNSALPPLGSVDMALSCRNKTLDDCLHAVADALDLPAHGDGWRAAAQVVQQVGELGRRVTVVLDGLDEAKAAEAVPIAADLLRPLADLPGVRVLVGTRPHRVGGTAVSSSTGPLLQALAPDETAVLDDEPDTRADLIAYARRRLLGAEHSRCAAGRHSPGTGPCASPTPAAGSSCTRGSPPAPYWARCLGPAVRTTSRTWTDCWPSNLTAVLDEEFGRCPDPARLRDLLRPLAWAEGAGLPRRDLWPVLAGALSIREARYGDEDVAWVLEHAGFHVVESGESGQTVYRLYHQALIDHFRGTSPWDAHARITRALLATLPGRGPSAWQSARPYLSPASADARARGGSAAQADARPRLPYLCRPHAHVRGRTRSARAFHVARGPPVSAIRPPSALAVAAAAAAHPPHDGDVRGAHPHRLVPRPYRRTGRAGGRLDGSGRLQRHAPRAFRSGAIPGVPRIQRGAGGGCLSGRGRNSTTVGPGHR
ncbi:hypothetical protein ACQ4WX_40835 [Streptomyces lasalocidi]